MSDLSIKERVARILYSNEGGVPDEVFEQVTGRKRIPWDSLEEYEKDEFLMEADAVVKELRYIGALRC